MARSVGGATLRHPRSDHAVRPAPRARRRPQSAREARRVLARFADRALLVDKLALCDVVARSHGFDELDGVLSTSASRRSSSLTSSVASASAPRARWICVPTGLRVTAADIVNSWDDRELRRVFAEYGEEPGRPVASRPPSCAAARGAIPHADDLGRFVHGVKTQGRSSAPTARRVSFRRCASR